MSITSGNLVTLENISFRIVGTFLRVNQPYSAVDPENANIPYQVTIPKLTVKQPATVATVMEALQTKLKDDNILLEYSNIMDGTVDTGTLDSVSVTFNVGMGNEKKFTLSATTSGKALQHAYGTENIGAAWQYYVFTKLDVFGQDLDKRIEVSGRSRYGKSPIIQNDYRIIWRLIEVHTAEKKKPSLGETASGQFSVVAKSSD